MTAPSLILASASPRRAEILQRLGLQFTIQPADIDETPQPGETPMELAERLAREKADRIATEHPGAVVVGSDTIVVVDEAVLGKPVDPDDAVQMLGLLSGRTHTVLTGVAACLDGHCVSGVESVDVTFRELSDHDRHAYVATGEPMDKAGSYGIQGYGAALVQDIRGDYFAVMGLPVVHLVTLFRRLGLRYAFGQGLQRAD